MDAALIEAIYRLSQGEHWSIRRIARHLGVSRDTVRKYRDGPVPRAALPRRAPVSSTPTRKRSAICSSGIPRLPAR